MPAAVKTDSVREALRPYLGSAMVEGTTVAEQAAQALRTYAPYRDELEDVAERVRRALFDCLYGVLGPRMAVRLDDGRMLRIRMQDLPELADAAMGALFEGMTVYSVNYQTLKDYSLRTGSLSAMRALYLRYDAFQPPEEKALMARVIRERYPRERYEGWLADA